jgi:hypothetical protein
MCRLRCPDWLCVLAVRSHNIPPTVVGRWSIGSDPRQGLPCGEKRRSSVRMSCAPCGECRSAFLVKLNRLGCRWRLQNLAPNSPCVSTCQSCGLPRLPPPPVLAKLLSQRWCWWGSWRTALHVFSPGAGAIAIVFAGYHTQRIHRRLL